MLAGPQPEEGPPLFLGLLAASQASKTGSFM